jgi:preprotein translocase subunit SecD
VKLAVLALTGVLVAAVLSSCEGDGGPSVLLVLEADLIQLPPDVNADDALEEVEDILKRRAGAFGGSVKEVSREGENRLSVRTQGIDPEEVRELLGKTAHLEFRKPVRDESGDVVCETEDGGTYAQPYQPGGLFVEDEANDAVICPPNEEGMVGVMLWEPATGTDSQGTERALTGSFLKANSRVEGPPPTVIIEFTPVGGLLFEQITAELVGLPLTIFLDEELIGAPTVNQPVTGGKASITGLSEDDARILAIQLNSGALPVPVNVISVEETL